ncbi:MAG: chromosome partitioning protein ParB, partial [Mycobacterium sp.]
MSQPSRRKGGLGRGLASLIPTGPADAGEDPTPGGPRLGAAAADVMFGGPPPAGAPTDIGAVY